jgi:hypothetical protein
MKSHRVKNEKRSPYPQRPQGEPATDDGSHLWAAIVAIPKKKKKAKK